MKPLIEEHLAKGWSLARIAAMSTNEIQAQLREFGVDPDQNRFLTLSQTLVSAWELARLWFKQDPVTCQGLDEDFVCLAACELWKRWLPERPSLEMIDDWIDAGYDVETSDVVSAAELWWKAWTGLKPLLQPQTNTMDAAQSVQGGYYDLHNWCHDFEMALHNAYLRDSRFIATGHRYCREWIEQFPAESSEMQVSFRRALAEFTFRMGEVKEAQKILETSLAQWPQNPWCYIALADAWSHLFADPQHHLPFDREKAREYLMQGLKRLPPGKRAELQERLDWLDEAVPVDQRPDTDRKEV